MGRIADVAGSALLARLRTDTNLDVRATAVFSMGQLKDPATVAWLGTTLSAATTPPAVAREAAQALGKFVALEPRRDPQTNAMRNAAAVRAARGALASVSGKGARGGDARPRRRSSAKRCSASAACPREDIAPIARFATSANVEVRWRATWALFRPRNPAAMPHILKLVDDPSGDVRFWAVRGLRPPWWIPPAWTASSRHHQLRGLSTAIPTAAFAPRLCGCR